MGRKRNRRGRVEPVAWRMGASQLGLVWGDDFGRVGGRSGRERKRRGRVGSVVDRERKECRKGALMKSVGDGEIK